MKIIIIGAGSAVFSLRLVTDLVGLLGARPHFFDPHEHDGLIGGTEHIADVLSVVLLHTLTSSGGWRDMRRLCGATFDACIRYLGEDPWERIRKLKAKMPNMTNPRWLTELYATSFFQSLWARATRAP